MISGTHFYEEPFFVYGYGQTKHLTDSTLIVGVVIKDYFAGISVNELNCTTWGVKTLTVGTPVIVCGINRCFGLNSIDTTDFFEIFYHKKSYFVSKQNLQLINDISFNDLFNFLVLR
jgi:hypothetical protein